MKRLRTAVIGMGNMGQNHARIYSEISDLVAVVDLISERKILGERYHAKFYKSYEDMINKEQPDAVSVVVPTHFHSAVVLDCLRHKIPTLVEKPIAETLKEARLMIEASKKEKTFLMVGHIERFNPAITALKALINENKLGSIISILAIRVGINPPKVKNANVALDLSIHDIDVFNYLLDSYPTSKKIINHKVFKSNISDVASLMLEYPGVTCLIQTNWITPIKMRKLLVTGTRGYCEVDYIKQKLTFYDKGSLTKGSSKYSEFVSISDSPKRSVYISKKEPLREELTFFLKSIDNVSDYGSVVNAYKALEILLK